MFLYGENFFYAVTERNLLRISYEVPLQFP